MAVDPTVAERRAMESKVASAAITGLLAAGYTVSVDDGEDRPIRKSSDHDAILAAMFSVDEERLIAHNADGKRVGSVFFVYGNDGPDAINDYSISLEAPLAAAMALADVLAEEATRADVARAR